jgi:hypothetical protein
VRQAQQARAITTGADVFVARLCAGMGFLIDMAIIVSAARYKMHTVRADPRELVWRKLARWVLLLGLASESMTLLRFFVRLSPAVFPDWLRWLARMIHSTLAVSRAFLPPVILAYFVAGILPVVVERGDRNRGIKERTSQNIMVLIDKLSAVDATDDKQDMLKALGGQLMLDTCATDDATAQTTERDQAQRDMKLLKHLANLNGLPWDFVADLLEDTAASVSPPADDRDALDALPLFNGHRPSVSKDCGMMPTSCHGPGGRMPPASNAAKRRRNEAGQHYAGNHHL